MPPCRCMGQSRIMGEPLHSASSVCKFIAATVQASMRASAATHSLGWLLGSAQSAILPPPLPRQICPLADALDKPCLTEGQQRSRCQAYLFSLKAEDSKNRRPGCQHALLQQAQTPHMGSLPPATDLPTAFVHIIRLLPQRDCRRGHAVLPWPAPSAGAAPGPGMSSQASSARHVPSHLLASMASVDHAGPSPMSRTGQVQPLAAARARLPSNACHPCCRLLHCWRCCRGRLHHARSCLH